MSERIILRPAPEGAGCDVHDWPSDGLGRSVFDAMRAKSGGVNICRACLARAKADLASRLSPEQIARVEAANRARRSP